MPDAGPDAGGPPCWHHDERFACVALGNKLALDRETRRLTSIGLDLAVWLHARSRLGLVPQREFLARYETGRHWNGRATPPLGLARGAVLYHLPATGADGPTPAEMFDASPLFPKICAAEREWLHAQRRARLSYYEVTATWRRGVRLRDWFGELSGRRPVWIEAGEIPERDVAVGQTVFARLIPFRGKHYVDLLQFRTSLRECVADPREAPAAVWRIGGERLRDRTGMTNELFETWKRET